MKYIKTLTYPIFFTAVLAVCGQAQARKATSTCDWDIALPPAANMTTTYAEWELFPGYLSVSCLEVDGVRTTEDARKVVAHEVLETLKKATPSAKVTSETPLTVSDFEGTKSLVEAGTDIVEVRIVAKGFKVYLLLGLSKSDGRKRMQERLDSFTIRK